MVLRTALLFLLLLSSIRAEQNLTRDDLLYANLAGAAAITGWGLMHWDYGKSSPHRADEGWFGKETKYGGADKLGHFYASYLLGTGLTGLYEGRSHPSHDAALYGALSSFFLTGLMEAGDAFSPTQGFSREDFWMNAAGAAASYLFALSPDLARKADLRLEYIPSLAKADILTEYERMKYLIALKAEGFDTITHPVLRYTELHFGYYTRHYTQGSPLERERILYVGIGINLSRLMRENGYSTAGRILNYYQLPYTYIPMEYDCNRQEKNVLKNGI